MPPVRETPLGVTQLRAWAERGRLWAVADATDTPAVVARARAVGEARACSLYRGRAEEELFAIAPYLFHVDLEIFDWLIADLWAAPWGILALADIELDALRLHLRRFLTVEAPDGDSWYFRFYDPRVLRRFLATCTDAETAEFFGPIRAFAVTDPASYGVTVLAPAGPAVAPPPQPQRVVVRR